MDNYDHQKNNARSHQPSTPQPAPSRLRRDSNPFTPIPPHLSTFLAFLNHYTFTPTAQTAIALAQMTASKRLPPLSRPSTDHSPCLALARRHLVTIFVSRGPVTDDEVMNPIMNEVFRGPMTLGVWRLVYELADVEQGIGDKGQRVRMKKALVGQLVRCLEWEGEVDRRGEARRLVEEVFPEEG